MGRVALVAMLAAALAGCGVFGGGPSAPGPGAEGAVPLADDLYMVPGARDAGGCQQYSMVSQSRATVQAVFYRTPAGDFTTVRHEAACRG